MGYWRYFARRLDTSGGQGAVIHPDLPLSGVSLKDALSAPGTVDATIDPVFATLLADDGAPILDEWNTEIYAELDGAIMGGGILTHSDFNGPEWTIECTGHSGYPHGMPCTDSIYFVETDVFDIVRWIWGHLQGQKRGDLGVILDDAMSGKKIGKELHQDQFDPGGDDSLTFESGPYKLSWYDTPDLGQKLDDLATSTPFEWHERHYWDGDEIRHFISLARPTIGRRRTDLRYIVGENVTIVPSVERNGEDFANEILGLGAGDGRTMLRGYAAVNDGKLRRVAVVEDKSANSKREIDAVSKTELAWRNRLDDVTSIVAKGPQEARVGDEIRLAGDADWKQLDVWVRILSITIAPETSDDATLEVIRSDKVGVAQA